MLKLITHTIFLILLLFSQNLYAHTFTGMKGFYDGLSHPILGLDHFIAMISVGIISAQIGGRAIWIIPTNFVSIMIVGGIIGISAEILHEDNLNNNISIFIELGIILSVILLGLAIVIEKKLSIFIIMFFVGIFGLCHGAAHGLEMPRAFNPILFSLGFTTGTASLHLFGVMIGYYFIKTKISSFVLRIIGLLFAIYGFFLYFNFL